MWKFKIKPTFEIDKKKDLTYKLSCDFSRNFKHSIWSKYFTIHQSSANMKVKDLKPEIKLSTSFKTENNYKFFTEVKAQNSKGIYDIKTNIQF